VTLRSRKPGSGSRIGGGGEGLQWGRDLAVTETSSAGRGSGRRHSFNGAVTLRSRKRGNCSGYCRMEAPLQWGRDLAVTETCRMIYEAQSRPGLQWGRDLAVTETSCRSTACSTSSGLQWGRDLAVTETAPAQMPVGSALCYETASGLRRVGDLAASSQLLTRWRSPEIPYNRPLRAPSAHPSPPRRSRRQVRSSSCSSFTLRLSGCQGTRAATPPRSGFFPLPSSGPAP
jgi:hypothetical protein